MEGVLDRDETASMPPLRVCVSPDANPDARVACDPWLLVALCLDTTVDGGPWAGEDEEAYSGQARCRSGTGTVDVVLDAEAGRDVVADGALEWPVEAVRRAAVDVDVVVATREGVAALDVEVTDVRERGGRKASTVAGGLLLYP